MSNSYLGGRTAPAAILCEAMVSVAPPSVGPTSGGVLQAGRCIPVQSAVLWSRSFRRTRLGFGVDIDIIEDGRKCDSFSFLSFWGLGGLMEEKKAWRSRRQQASLFPTLVNRHAGRLFRDGSCDLNVPSLRSGNGFTGQLHAKSMSSTSQH